MVNKTDLIAKLRMAQTSSCSCMTKTPEVSWHDVDCRYRVLAEAIEFIAAPIVEADGMGEAVAVVVEETHNYLGYLVFGAIGSRFERPRPVVEKKAVMLKQDIPSGTKL